MNMYPAVSSVMTLIIFHQMSSLTFRVRVSFTQDINFITCFRSFSCVFFVFIYSCFRVTHVAFEHPKKVSLFSCYTRTSHIWSSSIHMSFLYHRNREKETDLSVARQSSFPTDRFCSSCYLFFCLFFCLFLCIIHHGVT